MAAEIHFFLLPPSLKSYEKLLFLIFCFFFSSFPFNFIWVAKKRTKFSARGIVESKYFELTLLFAALPCDFCELPPFVRMSKVYFIRFCQPFAAVLGIKLPRKVEDVTEFIFLKHGNAFFEAATRLFFQNHPELPSQCWNATRFPATTKNVSRLRSNSSYSDVIKINPSFTGWSRVVNQPRHGRPIDWHPAARDHKADVSRKVQRPGLRQDRNMRRCWHRGRNCCGFRWSGGRTVARHVRDGERKFPIVN